MIVRPAVLADAAAIAAVHVASWRDAYPGLLPQEMLDGLDVANREAQWQRGISRSDPPHRAVLVAEVSERVVGFVSTGPTRDGEGDPRLVGELVAIYVAPDVLGTGCGRALMQAALGALRDANYHAATLWVLAGNERAIRFYRAAGWRADGRTKVDHLGGVPVTEARYAHTLGR